MSTKYFEEVVKRCFLILFRFEVSLSRAPIQTLRAEHSTILANPREPVELLLFKPQPELARVSISFANANVYPSLFLSLFYRLIPFSRTYSFFLSQGFTFSVTHLSVFIMTTCLLTLLLFTILYACNFIYLLGFSISSIKRRIQSFAIGRVYATPSLLIFMLIFVEIKDSCSVFFCTFYA